MRRNYQNVFCEQLLWKIMNEVKFIFKLCQLECFRAFIEEIFKLIRNKVMKQDLFFQNAIMVSSGVVIKYKMKKI